MATIDVNWLGSNIEQDSTHRLVTDEQIEKWNNGGGYKVLETDLLDFDTLEDGKYIYYVKFNDDGSLKEDQWVCSLHYSSSFDFGTMCTSLDTFFTESFSDKEKILLINIINNSSLINIQAIDTDNRKTLNLIYGPLETKRIYLTETSVEITAREKIHTYIDNKIYFNDIRLESLDRNLHFDCDNSETYLNIIFDSSESLPSITFDSFTISGNINHFNTAVLTSDDEQYYLGTEYTYISKYNEPDDEETVYGVIARTLSYDYNIGLYNTVYSNFKTTVVGEFKYGYPVYFVQKCEIVSVIDDDGNIITLPGSFVFTRYGHILYDDRYYDHDLVVNSETNIIWDSPWNREVKLF